MTKTCGTQGLDLRARRTYDPAVNEGQPINIPEEALAGFKSEWIAILNERETRPRVIWLLCEDDDGAENLAARTTRSSRSLPNEGTS